MVPGILFDDGTRTQAHYSPSDKTTQSFAGQSGRKERAPNGNVDTDRQEQDKHTGVRSFVFPLWCRSVVYKSLHHHHSLQGGISSSYMLDS